MHYINILTKFQRLLVLHLIHGSLHSEKRISNVRKTRLDNIGIAHHASYIMQHVIIEFGHFLSSLAKRTFRCIGSSLNIELLSIDRILAVSHRTSLASVRCAIEPYSNNIRRATKISLPECEYRKLLGRGMTPSRLAFHTTFVFRGVGRSRVWLECSHPLNLTN